MIGAALACAVNDRRPVFTEDGPLSVNIIALDWYPQPRAPNQDPAWLPIAFVASVALYVVRV